MKKILSGFIICFILFILVVPAHVFAAPGGPPATPTPTGVITVGIMPTPQVGDWLPDSDVTFAGKLAARSAQMLDWILANVGWANSTGPIADFWVTIRDITFAFLALMVLGTAFVLVITRGKSIGARKFIPRFFFAVIFVTLSFSIVQFLYIVADIIQRQFLSYEGTQISSADLLNVAFNYNQFTGLKRFGLEYEESAFISTLLVKLTAITFYVMAGLLIVRKIILWFFIAVSPVLPLLLFYYPVRNTAKIWIGEFFRWLLYAPLFAIFLYSVVIMWKNEEFATTANNVLFFSENQVGNTGVRCDDLKDPTNPDYNGLSDREKTCYPIAINILLGGPGQRVVYEENGPQNSVTRPDTFALYVVALIMLWVVIILPFVLLQIFLEYFYSFAGNENSVMMQLFNRGANIFNKTPPSPSPISPSPKGAGLARVLPFITPKKSEPKGQAIQLPKGAGLARDIPIFSNQASLHSTNQSSPILRLTQLSVPTIRDIARFESSTLSKDFQHHHEVVRVRETLEKIANPQLITIPSERQQFSSVREQLIQERMRGNPTASAILQASSSASRTLSSATSQQYVDKTHEALRQITNPLLITNPAQRETVTRLKETLIRESQSGNTLASTVLKTAESVAKEDSSIYVHDIVTKIQSPQILQSSSDRQTFTQLKEILTQESQKGNSLATAIISSAQNISLVAQSQSPETSTQNVLVNIANPQTVPSQQRETITQLKETIVSESKKGNNLATTILNMSNRSQISTVTDSEIQNVSQQIIAKQAQGDLVAKTLTTKVDMVSQPQQVLMNLAHPESLPGKERETYIQLKETLVSESQKGNDLATTILNMSNKTQTSTVNESEIQNVMQQIVAKQKQGDLLATAIVATAQNLSNPQSLVIKAEKIIVQLANPDKIESLKDKTLVIQLKDTLTTEKEKGNDLATTILNLSNKSRTSSLNKSDVQNVTQQLITKQAQGDVVATKIVKSINTIADQSAETSITKITELLKLGQAQGDPVASRLVSVVNSEKNLSEKTLKEKLKEQSQRNDSLAQALLAIMGDKETQVTQAGSSTQFPVANRVQQVSLDDYEAVKKLWQENYQKLEPPRLNGKQVDRKEWIQHDLSTISDTINLLLSTDSEKTKEGMSKVSNILPFLLIGGFSQQEVIAYLKAKLEAAKATLNEIDKQEQEEESTVEVDRKTEEKPKEMMMEEKEENAVPAQQAVTKGVSDEKKPQN